MTLNREKGFEPGDVVITISDEQDIELIPKGTHLQLIRLNSEGLWSAHGKISGILRPLLVYDNNLEQAF